MTASFHVLEIANNIAIFISESFCMIFPGNGLLIPIWLGHFFNSLEIFVTSVCYIFFR